jgi:enoyl-CoA hydratase/carnithine racemase
MRADRGFFCFPEVDGRLPFTPGATALLTARFPIQAIHEAMIAARRYGGEDARAAGFVEATAPEDGVLDAALRDARALGGKDPATVGAIKRTTWAPVLGTLRDRPANRVPMDVFAQAIAMLGS